MGQKGLEMIHHSSGEPFQMMFLVCLSEFSFCGVMIQFWKVMSSA